MILAIYLLTEYRDVWTKLVTDKGKIHDKIWFEKLDLLGLLSHQKKSQRDTA